MARKSRGETVVSIPKTRLTLLTLAWAFAATVAVAAKPDVPQTAVLIENVRIFDGQSPRLSGPSNVLVVGNTIQAISPRPVSPPAGMQVMRIAGGGRTLMPGLIDNHVHIALSTTGQAELLSPETTMEVLQARATREAGDMLMRGFTAVRDLGGPLLKERSRIDKGELPGPRIYASGAMVSQTSGHGDSRLPHERSRRFFGEVSKGEQLGANFIADGRDDAIDPPKNSLMIANQIPFSWLAFFDGGHSFLYTSPKHFADTVNAFLQ